MMDAEAAMRKALDGTFARVCRITGEITHKVVPKNYRPPLPPETNMESRKRPYQPHRWTKKEDALLLELRGKGWKYERIAEEMRTRGEYGCRDRYLFLQRHKPCRPAKTSFKWWPPSEIERIAAMVKAEEPYTVIAARLWRPYHQVRKCIAYLQQNPEQMNAG